MTLRPAGEARLDLYTDAMLLDIGPDTHRIATERMQQTPLDLFDYSEGAADDA